MANIEFNATVLEKLRANNVRTQEVAEGLHSYIGSFNEASGIKLCKLGSDSENLRSQHVEFYYRGENDLLGDCTAHYLIGIRSSGAVRIQIMEHIEIGDPQNEQRNINEKFLDISALDSVSGVAKIIENLFHEGDGLSSASGEAIRNAHAALTADM